MVRIWMGTIDTLAHLPQGDLRLLDTRPAQRLLTSTIPARMAYTARDGTPPSSRRGSTGPGDELVMATFLAAPHVPGPSRRVPTLGAHPDVAVTIDTEGFPPEVLLLRGRIRVEEVDGVAAEYAAAARRYQGEEAGAQYLAFIDQPGTRTARIALRPTWAGLLNFRTRSSGAMTT